MNQKQNSAAAALFMVGVIPTQNDAKTLEAIHASMKEAVSLSAIDQLTHALGHAHLGKEEEALEALYPVFVALVARKHKLELSTVLEQIDNVLNGKATVQSAALPVSGGRTVIIPDALCEAIKTVRQLEAQADEFVEVAETLKAAGRFDLAAKYAKQAKETQSKATRMWEDGEGEEPSVLKQINEILWACK